MAQKRNITLDQGTDIAIDFTMTDSSGLIIDYSSSNVHSIMMKTYTSNTSYSFNVTAANTGIVTLAMNAATSSTLIPGRYVYDIKAVDQSGLVTRLVEGIATVMPQVTI